ncbi:MAG: mechanosensitive ion channel family protein [Gemmatimonadota bacterium]|nr:mechanosensitive ion channel family protein [Gemmatimonadota bacterium]MDE2870737.1 mechanosensitive ion channel family protein [Gemmatimonadota bacterium]
MSTQLAYLQGLWNEALRYAEPRWLPSLVVLLLAGVIYIVAGWILRRVEKRLAALTETELDDEFLRSLRKVVRLTVVAWAVSQLLDEWVQPLAAVIDGVRQLNDVQPQDWVWGIWTVLVFFPISRFVGHLMATFEQKVMSRTDTALDETALPMVNRFVRFLVIAVGVLLALPQVGISIAPLLGGAGVMGLALSFAAKDTLSNLIAGVLLIMDRPFKVGDRIELWNAPRETGTWGDVIEIGLRATKIRNPDNLVVVVPNNEIMRRDIINYTMSGDDIRLRIPFSCAYEADIERAKVLLKQVAREVKGVKLDPAPIVIVRGFGPSEVNLQLRVWIVEARSRRRIADEITERAMVAFAEAGVEIPYPKRELYIKGGGAEGLLPSGG